MRTHPIKSNKTHHVDVYVSRLKQDNSPLLTTCDKLRLHDIKSTKAKTEFLYSHSLLNKLLIDKLDIDIKDLGFTYNPQKKPFLSKVLFDSTRLYFSLSHSSKMVVIGLSTGVDIGVDIEDISKRSVEACQKLTERYYSNSEQNYLSDYCNDSKSYKQNFFQIWTLKEAYLKAIGTGINISLSSISFTLSGNNIELDDSNRNDTGSYSFYSNILADYSLGVAAETAGKLSIKIHNI